MIKKNEAQAVYLNDYSHYSDVERMFLEVRENYDKGGLVVMVKRLWRKGAISDKERQYLYHRITDEGGKEEPVYEGPLNVSIFQSRDFIRIHKGCGLATSARPPK